VKLRQLTADERGKAIQEAFAGATGHVLELRAGGVAVADDRRAALLAAAVAREAVEIELDVLAFEQRPGERNRNCFRFRDGAMMNLGRTGKGTPFLRDHDKWSVDAISGEVIESKTVKVAEGHYEVRQTVRLTEPSAVERALRGNLKAVSIGAMPTGPVLCSLCGTPIFEDCYHWRGDEVDVDGQAVVIEWIYTEAELVETSEVPIGAVPRAGVQTIRAAIAAAGNANGGRGPQEHSEMKNRAAIVAKLKVAGLVTSAEPTDEEIGAALDQLLGDHAELQLVQHQATAQAQTAEDRFIADGLASGRILTADVDVWRSSFRASPDRAQALMAKRPANCATPVGQPPQRERAEPTDQEAAAAARAAAAGTTPEALDRDTKARKVLEAHHVPYNDAIRYAGIFGADNPKAAVAKHCAGIEEV
jgi:hypothetical protein